MNTSRAETRGTGDAVVAPPPAAGPPVPVELGLPGPEVAGPEASPDTGAAPPRRRRPRAAVLVPAAVLVLLALAAVLAPLLGLPDPDATDLRESRLLLATDGHLLGTDALGRDLLARSLAGARVSLTVGVSSVVLGLVIGGLLGVLAGFRGGWLDTVVMRTMDMVLAFPSLVLALVIATYLGPSVPNVIFAITLFTIPAYARVARAGTLSLREREFVLAGELFGAPWWKVVARHVVPNVALSLVTYGMVALGVAIIGEASLSFLGLGVQPPTASWGIMISEGNADLANAPHIVLVPGVFLFVTVLCVNLLGDALRAGSRTNRGAL